jgi:hypothetical protein
MKERIYKLGFGLAIAGLLLAATGCDERDWESVYGRHDGGWSVTDVAIGLGFTPPPPAYYVVDEYVEEHQTFYHEDVYSTNLYAGGDYYDGYCTDCGW